jgi:hypothetical protein
LPQLGLGAIQARPRVKRFGGAHGIAQDIGTQVVGKQQPRGFVALCTSVSLHIGDQPQVQIEDGKLGGGGC